MTTTSTDEVENLINELAKAFEAAALTAPTPDGAALSLKVVRGFPRHDPLELPCLSLEAGLVTRRHQAAQVISVTPIEGSSPPMVRVVWIAQKVNVVVNIDLWTSTKTQRYSLRPQLEQLFRPDMDEPHGLNLVLAASNATPARVVWLNDTVRDAEGEDDGIRRLAITARADFNRLIVETRQAATFTVNTSYTETL